MYLGINILAEDNKIGRLFLELLNAVIDKLVELGSMGIFWVVLVIVIFTLLMATIKSKNSDSAFAKIEEAIYDSGSLLISLFYDIIGVVSVVLNFIRTLTEMLFGDLSENLLKRLFAFAIIAFSITSFATTFLGMRELFDFYAVTVSFGLQILVLGLAYKIVMSTDSIHSHPDLGDIKLKRDEIYKKAMMIPLLIVTSFILIPMAILMLYNADGFSDNNIALNIVIITALAIFTVVLTVQILSAFFGNNKELYITNIKFQGRSFIVYIVLALAIFTSSFFSYTNISGRFIEDQIDTDYLIATSTRAVDNLDKMDTNIEDATGSMTRVTNYLLDEVYDYYSFTDGSGSAINYTPSSLNTIKAEKTAEIVSYMKELLAIETAALKIELTNISDDIAEIDEAVAEMNIDDENEYKRVNEYDNLVERRDELEGIFAKLAEYDVSEENNLDQMKIYLDAAEVATEDDEKISKYYNEIADFDDMLNSQYQMTLNDYTAVGTDIDTIRSFLIHIRHYDNYDEAVSESQIENILIDIKNYIIEEDINITSNDNIDSIISNLMGIKQYYSNRDSLELLPREEVQERVKEYFASIVDLEDSGDDTDTDETDNEDNTDSDENSENSDADSDEAEKKTAATLKDKKNQLAQDKSLEILNIVFKEVVDFPVLESVTQVGDILPFTPSSEVETEKNIYVQIRTLNGEMKGFEKYLRKLYDRDAFPEMALFALFIALLIDVGSVILFILRGKDGPFGDTKLNSKRVIYLHAVENDKRPKKMASIVEGTIYNIVGAIVGGVLYCIAILVYDMELEFILALAFVIGALMLANLIKTIVDILRNKKIKSTIANSKDGIGIVGENAYEAYSFKYDMNANGSTDRFYEHEIFKNKFKLDRSKYYFGKLYWRYIERLRERYLDSFVLFLCDLETVRDGERIIIADILIKKYNNDEMRKEKSEASAKLYGAFISHEKAKEYNVVPMLLSLLTYDTEIVLIDDKNYYIHNNFFMYVNELLWSRNSQYSNYGLDYIDHDADERMNING